jgi:ferredoxin
MKFYFAYSSFGNQPLRTTETLTTIIGEKNSSAKFIGSIAIHAPENGINLLPPKAIRDRWLKKEEIRLEQFGYQLADILSSKQSPPTRSYKINHYKTVFPPRIEIKFAGKPELSKDICVQCGTCVSSCPYNAISLDIEDVYPTVDKTKCRGCGRCFNLCPERAIEFPQWHSELRSRYPKPNFVEPGMKMEDGAISQEAPSGLTFFSRLLIGMNLKKFYFALAIILLLIISIKVK